MISVPVGAERNTRNVVVNNTVKGKCKKMSQEFIVPGFLASGMHCGIKADGNKDLALIFSATAATAAGVFTKNAFKAAPVLIDQEKMRHGTGQAIIVNSGVANAATGEEGLDDARRMSAFVSRELNIADELVFVGSTGIIGDRLPLNKIQRAVPALVGDLRETGWMDAEQAIMTTDKIPKLSFIRKTIGGQEVSLCGIAKGAGMIEPHMATMLSFLATDVAVEREILDKVFRGAIDKTFNAVTVDGCMSTNDTALILANGRSGIKPVRQGRDLQIFKDMLHQVLSDLAFMMVQDGEGATKVIEFLVEEAKSQADARKIAYAVANSNLVKTAFYGGDPNWGRIIAAIGSVREDIPVHAVKVDFDDVPIFTDGKGVLGVEKNLREIMASPRVSVRIRMGMGVKRFRVLASDLTHEYITINAHYRT